MFLIDCTRVTQPYSVFMYSRIIYTKNTNLENGLPGGWSTKKYNKCQKIVKIELVEKTKKFQ
jgi:hypothetical protein